MIPQSAVQSILVSQQDSSLQIFHSHSQSQQEIEEEEESQSQAQEQNLTNYHTNYESISDQIQSHSLQSISEYIQQTRNNDDLQNEIQLTNTWDIEILVDDGNRVEDSIQIVESEPRTISSQNRLAPASISRPQTIVQDLRNHEAYLDQIEREYLLEDIDQQLRSITEMHNELILSQNSAPAQNTFVQIPIEKAIQTMSIIKTPQLSESEDPINQEELEQMMQEIGMNNNPEPVTLGTQYDVPAISRETQTIFKIYKNAEIQTIQDSNESVYLSALKEIDDNFFKSYKATMNYSGFNQSTQTPKRSIQSLTTDLKTQNMVIDLEIQPGANLFVSNMGILNQIQIDNQADSIESFDPQYLPMLFAMYGKPEKRQLIQEAIIKHQKRHKLEILVLQRKIEGLKLANKQLYQTSEQGKKDTKTISVSNKDLLEKYLKVIDQVQQSQDENDEFMHKGCQDEVHLRLIEQNKILKEDNASITEELMTFQYSKKAEQNKIVELQKQIENYRKKLDFQMNSTYETIKTQRLMKNYREQIKLKTSQSNQELPTLDESEKQVIVNPFKSTKSVQKEIAVSDVDKIEQAAIEKPPKKPLQISLTSQNFSQKIDQDLTQHFKNQNQGKRYKNFKTASFNAWNFGKLVKTPVASSAKLISNIPGSFIESGPIYKLEIKEEIPTFSKFDKFTPVRLYKNMPKLKLINLESKGSRSKMNYNSQRSGTPTQNLVTEILSLNRQINGRSPTRDQARIVDWTEHRGEKKHFI